MHQVLDNCFLKSCISFQFLSHHLKVEIETERLFIRSYEESDFENCISLYGDETITKYFDHGKVRNKLEVENLIFEKGKKYFSKFEPFGLFSIFRKKDGNFIGQIDFLPSEEWGVVEIGFILHKEYQNQGFCTEAAKAIIFDYVEALNNRHFNFHEFPINKIMATVHPKNQASRKVLQKVGLTLDKIQARFGQPRLWYSMSASLFIKNHKIGS